MWEIAHILKISKSSVENHLHQLGYVNCFDVWVPQKLSEKNLLDRISTCDSLLRRNEHVPFFKKLWRAMKSGYCTTMWNGRDGGASEMNHHQPHQRPVFIQRRWCCIWWDWRGVLYYELFPENQTINSNKYCFQLDQLKAALNEKRLELVNRKRIIFHQDTARQHVSLTTRQKLLQLGWEVLIHLPYSPDIAPSDCHLFRSLQNSLNGKNANFLEDCKRHVEQFFAQKDKTF